MGRLVIQLRRWYPTKTVFQKQTNGQEIVEEPSQASDTQGLVTNEIDEISDVESQTLQSAYNASKTVRNWSYCQLYMVKG